MDQPAERRDAAARRARLVARERGLARASSVTVRVAVAGAAATVAAAVVFAQTPPSTQAAAGPVVPGAAVPASGATVATEGDGGASRAGPPGTAGTDGDHLQPPNAVPEPTSGRHHHATSSPS